MRPILVQHCIKCHGPDKQKGGLRLDSKPGWQTGGDNGPAIKPSKPDESLLIKAVRGDDGTAQMPPNAKLTPAEVTQLLFRESGLLGISGVSSDMRTLEASPEPAARLAIDHFVEQDRDVGSAKIDQGHHLRPFPPSAWRLAQAACAPSQPAPILPSSSGLQTMMKAPAP